ncbi:hypothetical protein [Cohnella sp. AR92]|uniref:hypothetical protein n=1 Tax=Cohnella sp. AR92 TaxID=648716 RepID=UPI000F8E6FA3|nr:hypothetical protein [Cohnella sp. AR92]RUS48257.1 hypothetical protein ELR57_06960 [Cohnella sp. AR92]
MRRENFIRKLIVALITSSLLSFIMAIIMYVPLSEQKPGSAYWSVPGLWIVYFIFSTLIIIIGGIPYSFFIDSVSTRIKFLEDNKIKRILLNSIMYIFGGFLIFTIFVLFDSNEVEFNDFVSVYKFYIFGVIGALLFYYFDEIARLLIQKRE